MLFLFLDCETTNLNFNDGQIIELAGSLCSLQMPTDFFDQQSLIFHRELTQVSAELENFQKGYFNQISEFEILIKLRSDMDKKTVRITGIDQNMLRVAPKIETAQQTWENWLKTELEKWKSQKNCQNEHQNNPDNETVADNYQTDDSTKIGKMGGKTEKTEKLFIVGHSLDFDLGFLRHEKWFLPEFIKIDTLELAKIFLPEVEAVNLEFLTKKLNLLPKSSQEKRQKIWESMEITSKIIDEKMNGTSVNLSRASLSTNLTKNPTEKNQENGLEKELKTVVEKSENNFHRALFDAKCCQNLLNFLLKKQTSLPTEIHQLFYQKLASFLPTGIITSLDLTKILEFDRFDKVFDQNEEEKYGKKEKIGENSNAEYWQEIKFDLTGQRLLEMEERLFIWANRQTVKSLAQMLNQNLPKDLDLLVLQLVWIVLETKKTGQKLKLHTQKEYLVIAELFLEEA